MITVTAISPAVLDLSVATRVNVAASHAYAATAY
jgi:hypothetical protein